LGEMEMGPKKRHRKTPRVPYNIPLIAAVWDFAAAWRDAVHDKSIKATACGRTKGAAACGCSRSKLSNC